MTRPSLDGVVAKVDRAREHIKVLDDQLGASLPYQLDSDVIGMEHDPDEGQIIVTWEGISPDTRPWSIALGEVLYQLRSALDHLAWQLVLANGNRPNTDTAFPIYEREAAFEDGSLRKMRGISSEARAVIKALQPFSMWPSNPTDTIPWALHRLCNIDKHRVLNLTSVFVNRIVADIHWNADVSLRREFIASPRSRLEPNTILVKYLFDPAKVRTLSYPEDQVEVKFSLGIGVGITDLTFKDREGNPGQAPSLKGIMELALGYVEGHVISNLRRFID